MIVKKLLAAVSAATFVLLHSACARDRLPPVDDWTNPALPPCRPVDETRVPMPIWKPVVTRDGKLSTAPPPGVMYGDLIAGSEVPACVGWMFDDSDFDLTAARARPSAGQRGVKVTFQDGIEWVHGSCIVQGFFINEAASGIRDGWRTARLRKLNKFEIIASGRFCIAGSASASRHERIARLGPASVVRPSPGATLPTCRKSGEQRSVIPVWEPSLGQDDELRSEPPQGDGKLVFGGNMGWWTTVFIAVDEARVASSGQYCLARRHGPLNRQSRPK